MSNAKAPGTASSPWAPFGSRAFVLLWTATLISNTGTWMHDVGAGWLMTILSPSPAIVSLVQAATTLPIFLFALLAGAIADRTDRKKLLLGINVGLLVVVAVLALLVHLERMTPTLLLVFTLLIGTGTAFMAPAWQAIVPTLVPREQLKPAVALNSLSVNISRAIGPALAGVLIGTSGLAAPFIVNALSFIAIIAALLLWRAPAAKTDGLPPEPIGAAMLTGLRHVRHNHPMRATMARAAGFFLFASAYWALLPLIARGIPGADASFFGLLLGAIGTGAIAGALLLPKLRQKFAADTLVLYGTLGTAVVMLAYAAIEARSGLIAASLLAGFSWIAVLTCFNVSAQTALPDWVRARGLAIYMMVFFGSLALGSTVWGQVASATSNGTALVIATAALLLMLPITWRAKLGQGEQMDLSPSTFWPSPYVADDIGAMDQRGPVLVTIAYRIAASDQREFLHAIGELAKERYRDGAHAWGIHQNLEDPDEWLESFELTDWHTHLRQHQRVTVHDRALHEAVRKFHQGASEPIVKHWAGAARRPGETV